MDLWQRYAPELVTDLYELTMAASYLKEGMSGQATFSLFVRDYPPNRSYFVAAGLEHVIETVCNLGFSESSLEFIASTGKFSPDLLEYLRKFRFTGTIRAIPEGRFFFSQEPILEVTAPIIESQLLETLILNIIQLEVLIATKASRCVCAAQGRGLIDFSLRRTQGVDAGVKVARASYLAGFAGTSNVLAGQLYGIPTYGTMAHSYITSFSSEMDSFLAFARAFPDNTVLLIDTYDTLNGARKALDVARMMKSQGKTLKGVRLDSGDLAGLSKEVRRIFREAGFTDVQIMASGSLDEFGLKALVDAGAEIDIFAVGTRMGVSADSPYLDIAYKLVEYDGRPVLKLSCGKKTWLGKKQIYRHYDGQGMMKEDLLALSSEHYPAGEPLLETVVENGEPCRPLESLAVIRERFSQEWKTLPPPLREIVPAGKYPVLVSSRLQSMEEVVSREITLKEIEGASRP